MDRGTPNEKTKILVVDDENLYIDLLTVLLGDKYQIAVAKNGEQALRCAAKSPRPKLILLDWMMPGMNGLEVCRALKKLPETSHVPVIFLTVRSDVDDEIQGFDAGAVDYIRKPLSPPVVMARIRTHLALANQRQVLERLVEERTQEISALHKQALRNADELDQRVKQRTAELEAVNRELETFSYSVSHDLRAPLRTINGFSQILLEEYHDVIEGRGRDYLQRIRSSSQRMDELINDLLELSRVSRSRLKIESVDLSGLVRSVAEHIRQADASRDVEILVQDGVIAQGDVCLLRVAIENLLGNAWKFTGRNPGPRVEFGEEGDDETPVFFVKDNGVGFDEEYSAKLFDPFQRLHSTEEFPGTGIGLATVQRIINRHGGKVWGASELGNGAIFRFTLGSSRTDRDQS